MALGMLLELSLVADLFASPVGLPLLLTLAAAGSTGAGAAAIEVCCSAGVALGVFLADAVEAVFVVVREPLLVACSGVTASVAVVIAVVNAFVDFFVADVGCDDLTVSIKLLLGGGIALLVVVVVGVDSSLSVLDSPSYCARRSISSI